ncbi:ANTAR domain-containing protein [Streptomyces sp. NPDC004561]
MIGPDERAEQVTELRDEVTHLRRAVVSHALVDQAIGVVITIGGLRPEQGWEVLKHVSQHTNVKLRDVAHCLVRWPACGRLPEVIRRALPAAMEHARGTHTDTGGQKAEPTERCGRLG